MGGKDDDTSSGHWPWNEKTFQQMQAEHERFMKDLETHTQCLRKDTDSSISSTTVNSPFAAFKQFVDSSLHAFVDDLKNFPSNVSNLGIRMRQARAQRNHNEMSTSWRWTGRRDSPDYLHTELTRMSDEEKDSVHTATVQLLSESFKRNAHVPAEKIQRLFKDPEGDMGMLDRLAGPMLALGGAWFFTPETGDKLPTPSDWMWAVPDQRWLSVNWFKRSPYSPIQLERHAALGGDGAKWRGAFEDLLSATLDKPMASTAQVGYRPPFGKVGSTYECPGLDWMLSLQCRGILPPLLPQFWSNCQIRSPEEPLKSLLGRFPWSSESLPWIDDPAIKSCSPLYQEVSELMSQIGIKSTPSMVDHQLNGLSQGGREADFAQCPLGDGFEDEDRDEDEDNEDVEDDGEDLDDDDDEDDSFSAWQGSNGTEPTSLGGNQPETELDIYESPYFQHHTNAESPPHPFPRSGSLTFAGGRRSEAGRALILMEHFSETHDVEAMVALLNSWYLAAGNVDLLVDVPTIDAFPLVVTALQLSDLPDDDFWKRESRKESAKDLFHLVQLASGDVNKYDELKKRLADWGDGHLAHQDTTHAQPNRPRAEPHATADGIDAKKLPPKKPDVLSALTTTQTTRLPDGTVTTKVVLKQRFTDGREETTESVHTAKEDAKHQPEQPHKRQGWFWS